MAANFVEVFLAKEGHDGVVGINYLRKIELPLPFALLRRDAGRRRLRPGGGGQPLRPPRPGAPARRRTRTSPGRSGSRGPRSADGDRAVAVSPRSLVPAATAPLAAPAVLAIVASVDLATGLAGDPPSPGRTASSSRARAPAATTRRRADRGGSSRGPAAVYDDRDARGHPRHRRPRPAGLARRLLRQRPRVCAGASPYGAVGVQVGTAFALCQESGFDADLKQPGARRRWRAGDVSRAQPTGGSRRPGSRSGSWSWTATLSDPQVEADRQRVCDLGVLRSPYRNADGRVDYRCPAEPVDHLRPAQGRPRGQHRGPHLPVQRPARLGRPAPAAAARVRRARARHRRLGLHLGGPADGRGTGRPDVLRRRRRAATCCRTADPTCLRTTRSRGAAQPVDHPGTMGGTMSGPLQISYPPELPVSQRREDIAAAIRDHQVVIVAGETGSGKTTQLPKICLELGRGSAGLIGHTQPRRIAARSVAERIAEELAGDGLGSELGDLVGYQVRFTDRTSRASRVKLMTDGILLAELQRDRQLRRYDTIIIDEAHERSLNIDFLLGYLRRLLPRRPDLKLIITSATIDPERFATHFADRRGRHAGADRRGVRAHLPGRGPLPPAGRAARAGRGGRGGRPRPDRGHPGRGDASSAARDPATSWSSCRASARSATPPTPC